jgi:hypothetical protein
MIHHPPLPTTFSIALLSLGLLVLFPEPIPLMLLQESVVLLPLLLSVLNVVAAMLAYLDAHLFVKLETLHSPQIPVL